MDLKLIKAVRTPYRVGRSEEHKMQRWLQSEKGLVAKMVSVTRATFITSKFNNKHLLQREICVILQYEGASRNCLTNRYLLLWHHGRRNQDIFRTFLTNTFYQNQHTPARLKSGLRYDFKFNQIKSSKSVWVIVSTGLPFTLILQVKNLSCLNL